MVPYHLSNCMRSEFLLMHYGRLDLIRPFCDLGSARPLNAWSVSVRQARKTPVGPGRKQTSDSLSRSAGVRLRVRPQASGVTSKAAPSEIPPGYLQITGRSTGPITVRLYLFGRMPRHADNCQRKSGYQVVHDSKGDVSQHTGGYFPANGRAPGYSSTAALVGQILPVVPRAV